MANQITIEDLLVPILHLHTQLIIHLQNMKNRLWMQIITESNRLLEYRFATQNSKTTSFINIGNGTSLLLQQQYQQPISLSLVPQESLDRSRSFNRSNSLQNIPQPDNTPSSPYSQQPKILHQRLLLMQHHPSIFWYPILLIMGFQMLLMDLAFDQTHLSEDQIQLV